MSDYLLGHSPQEWDRLRAQHALWRSTLLHALDRLGVGEGAAVLDAGCGEGSLLLNLAWRVGPMGRAEGLERDPAAAAQARALLGDTPWATVQEGDLAQAALGGPYDAVLCRWVLSFAPDPGLLVERLAQTLRPGGVLLVQDYLHDPMSVFPHSPAIQAVIEAFRAEHRARGGDLRVAGRLPELMQRAGLELVEVEPRILAGTPGQPAWAWVERFLAEHTPTLVAAGRLSAAEQRAFAEAWEQARAHPGAVLFTPAVVELAARRPSR